MKHDDHREPLLPPEEEQQLRALLHEAVSDVAPRDGLAEVRRRTRQGRSSSRRWLPVLVGAGAVAATVVVATVAVDGMGDDPAPGPAAGGSEASEGFDPSQLIGSATAAYFIGDTPLGPRLYREFQPVSVGDPEQSLTDAVRLLAVDRGPEDPDYRTVWPAGSFADVRLERSRIVVELGTAEALEAPVGIAPEEQLLGVQQVVYTAEATVGESLPVTFEWQGAPAASVLGTDVPARVDRNRDLITAPVNISDPAEGTEITEESFVAGGSMADTVDEVRWRIADAGWAPDGSSLEFIEGVAAPAPDPAPFAPGWTTEPIDITGLAPGEYLFVVETEQAGQTSDSPALFTDTRTFTVR